MGDNSCRSGCRLVAGYLFRRAPFMAWSLPLGTRIRRRLRAPRGRAPSLQGLLSAAKQGLWFSPPTPQVCHRTRSRQGRFAPLKRWPPKAAAILDRCSYGGLIEMRSGRKNGSARVEQKNETASRKQVLCNFGSDDK